MFGLGSHRKQTPDEQKKLVGERAFAEVKCIDGDDSDCVHIGTTRRGTPVDIVRPVAEADRRICLGNIEFHYFAGYSGERKHNAGREHARGHPEQPQPHGGASRRRRQAGRKPCA